MCKYRPHYPLEWFQSRSDLFNQVAILVSRVTINIHVYTTHQHYGANAEITISCNSNRLNDCISAVMV